MTTSDEKDGGRIPELTLRDRLVAWWEGYDLSALKRRRREEGTEVKSEEPRGVPADHHNGRDRWGKPLWSATRIGVVERLWGQGFTTPGGTDHVPYLVLPLGLNPAMSVLDLGVGLGGSTRTMAGKFGCWATGLEAIPILAKEAMDRSVKAGLNKHAPIEPFDPENFTFSRRVDAIVYKEGLFTVRDKDQMFDGLEVYLKPRGQLLMTDYIAENEATIRALTDWASREPVEPSLWPLDRLTNAFAQRNLDLRIREDITETHKNLILSALRDLTQHLEQHAMDLDTKINVLDEVELWARRVDAINRGLKVYRFYALKPADASSN